MPSWFQQQGTSRAARLPAELATRLAGDKAGTHPVHETASNRAYRLN